MGIGLSYSYVAVYLSVERFGVHPTYRLSVHFYLWSGVILIWKYLKKFYYDLFCTHPSHTSERYYTLDYIHGFYELNVYVNRTCEKCGKTENFCMSKNEAPSLVVKKMVDLLESKGFRNAEDLDYD